MINTNLYIFNPQLIRLDIIDSAEGVSWLEKFSDAGTFELWCPITDKNVDLLQEGNLVWKGGKSVGVIEYKGFSTDSEGSKILDIKGRLAECFLDRRIVFPRLDISGKTSFVMQQLVLQNFVTPTAAQRVFPFLAVSTEESYGSEILYQNTGAEILSELVSLSELDSLGFRLEFLPRERKLLFRVYASVDRTIDQTEVPPVLFSTELDDILDSEYQLNVAEVKNVAYVAGEGEGAERKVEIVGSAEGMERRELYVDARDLQSEKEDGTVIEESQYRAILAERGNLKLEDYKTVESFSASIRVSGGSYVFGQDYNLGDIVTVYDSRLKVRANAIVTEVEETADGSGETFELTIGYAQPTIANKLKRRTN